MGAPSPHPCQALLFLVFLGLAILTNTSLHGYWEIQKHARGLHLGLVSCFHWTVLLGTSFSWCSWNILSCGHSRSLLRGLNVVFRVKCLAPCLPHRKPSLHQSKFQVHREIEGKVQRAPMDPQPPMHSLPPSPPHQMERLWHLRNRQSPQRVAYLIVHSWPRTLRGSRQMCGTYPSLWSRQSFAFSRMFHRWTHTVFVRTQVFSSTGEIPRSTTVGSYGRSSTFDSSSPSPRLPSQSGCCLPTGPKPS
ncbi:uncharacterized protein LOC131811305 [Mustela lutreola]|uniref:uncharacterized protein LOC131811305 n=1 Tax=Mustela lutreola TaxID=9666 RepID=UPI002797BD3A|nr:uncharacterized protein LOC131811305 [Mustela lutreola]